MSDKIIKEIPNLRCELVSGRDISFLEGKLKTIADATVPQLVGGDNNIQNKAIKDIIQTILWEWFNHITKHKTDHLFDKINWYVKENIPKYWSENQREKLKKIIK